MASKNNRTRMTISTTKKVFPYVTRSCTKRDLKIFCHLVAEIKGMHRRKTRRTSAYRKVATAAHWRLIMNALEAVPLQGTSNYTSNPKQVESTSRHKHLGHERKYDDVTEKVNLQNNPGAVEHFHMKLFRAQRNLYIAGFSLLMSFLLRRLITLISQHATILASNEAFKKQAEGASDAAKKYMEENDKLKKELKAAGVEVADLDTKGADVEEDNKALKAEVKELKEELASTKRVLEKAKSEALAMRKQAEGLTKEYDRLLEEHAKLQASCDGPRDKKEE